MVPEKFGNKAHHDTHKEEKFDGRNEKFF